MNVLYYIMYEPLSRKFLITSSIWISIVSSVILIETNFSELVRIKAKKVLKNSQTFIHDKSRIFNNVHVAICLLKYVVYLCYKRSEEILVPTVKMEVRNV